MREGGKVTGVSLSGVSFRKHQYHNFILVIILISMKVGNDKNLHGLGL